jgi:hypothetical protein
MLRIGIGPMTTKQDRNIIVCSLVPANYLQGEYTRHTTDGHTYRKEPSSKGKMGLLASRYITGARTTYIQYISAAVHPWD